MHYGEVRLRRVEDKMMGDRLRDYLENLEKRKESAKRILVNTGETPSEEKQIRSLLAEDMHIFDYLDYLRKNDHAYGKLEDMDGYVIQHYQKKGELLISLTNIIREDMKKIRERTMTEDEYNNILNLPIKRLVDEYKDRVKNQYSYLCRKLAR